MRARWPHLIALALIGPRWSPVSWLFSLLPVRPAELEPSRPVRFAQWIAITMLVVASVLMSMGMMMLSPMMISMPFKLMLFVLVDGWSLTMGSLAASFVMP